MAGSGTAGQALSAHCDRRSVDKRRASRSLSENAQRKPARDPGFDSLWRHYGFGTSERCIAVRERMLDIGERRIADMNAAGIDMQLLLLTTPGVQLLEAETAITLAAASNDQVSKAVERHPDRFAALAAVAPQAPQAAAKELERAVKAQGRRHQLAHPGRISRRSEILADFRGRRGIGGADLYSSQHAAAGHDRAAVGARS